MARITYQKITSSEKKLRANREVILPVLGHVKFDEDASIEIDEDLIEEIYELFPEFNPNYIKEVKLENLSKNQIIDEDTLEKKVVKADKLEDNSQAKEELIATLSILKVNELREMAVDYPEEEWKDLKKVELQEYLANKL